MSLLEKGLHARFRRLMKGYVTHNRIEVSRSALLHNFDLFARLTNKQIIPVLKSNAYGHGIPLVAKVLQARHFPYIAVDGYFEALRIREVSKQPVLIMSAILPENFKRLAYRDFAFVVGDETTIRALGKTGKRIKVHLECNTGMNRYGAKPAEITRLAKLILGYKNLTLEGVMSHLADSDGDDPSTVDVPVAMFDACVEQIRAAGANPTILHVAQSAGSLKAKSKYANTIRLGVGLYGINPFADKHALHDKLKTLRPALQMVSTITKVIHLSKGEKVSYNYTFTAPKAMTIGVLPVGYFEGVSRLLSSTGKIKIGQKFTTIVGRVCMNHSMINLDGLAAKVGDEVIVYSNNPRDPNAIDKESAAHDALNYTFLTALSSDVRRVLVP